MSAMAFKSPASRLFAQSFVQVQIKENIKTQRTHVTGLSEGNPPVIGEFPSQRGSNAENVSIWWRHHEDLPNNQWITALHLIKYSKNRNIPGKLCQCNCIMPYKHHEADPYIPQETRDDFNEVCHLNVGKRWNDIKCRYSSCQIKFITTGFKGIPYFELACTISHNTAGNSVEYAFLWLTC